jgi:tetratricopeptide (TPR) repeat protein
MSNNGKQNEDSLLNNQETNVNKEDKNLKVGDVITNTEVFLEKNKKALMIIVAAIVVVIGIFCIYNFWYMPSQEKAAEDEMYAAEEYFVNNDYDKALKGDGKHVGFIAVSEDYSHTKHGKLASFYIGRIYLDQGKYQQAVDYLEKFSPKDAFMASQSKALLGDAYWEMNQLDKAIEYYNKAAEINPNNFTTPAILMKLGAAYEVKGNNQKALDCYKKIKSDFPRSVEFQMIEKYISRMETLLGK